MEKNEKMLQNLRYLILLLGLFSCIQEESSPPLSPTDELASFQIEDELRIELVAAEPLVQDPVAMSFDEDGRLWVVEMRNFMPDIDGNGEEMPLGRISVLIDENQDGRMDRQHIFLDSLALPRAIACTQGGILVAEQKPLWFAKDTNGDFRADIKILVDSTYGGRGLVEHSPNGLWRGVDNWYYNAKADFRYRFQNGEWIKDKTEFRGQWGISHDDIGRLFYNYNWSQLHADLVPPNYLSRNSHHTPTTGIDHGLTLNRKVYPIRSNTAVNRGYVPGTLDKEQKLLEFASACSPFIYRSYAMSEDFYGNAFVCEPTANLIKRNIIIESDFYLAAEDAYPNREFLASTDERFRPVFLDSGPDGALYIVDMYRGIIQHGPYMTPYLRQVTLDRKLDQPINLGRIWRVKNSESKAYSSVKMSEIPSTELIDFLAHSSGWHRDIAQRLLVERQDINIVSSLYQMIREHEDPLGRLHALWTLEGLDVENPEIYFEALEDQDPHIQNVAIRLLEKRANDDPIILKKLEHQLAKMWPHASPKVRLQIALISGHFSSKMAFPILADLLTSYQDDPLIRDVVLSTLYNREFEMFSYFLNEPKLQQSEYAIFLEMLSRAIANKGNSEELMEMLAQLNLPADQFGWREDAILNGLLTYEKSEANARIALINQPEILKNTSQFPPNIQTSLLGLNDIFTWPGQTIESNESEHDLAEIDPSILTLGRQQYLTICAACHGTDGKGMKRFAPPLINSEWVLGEEKRLILLLLQGMQGPVTVNNTIYDVPDILPEMPAFSTIENNDLAAIMTYIRNAWGHHAPPIEAGRVGHIRFRSQGKITPWTAEELSEVSLEEIE